MPKSISLLFTITLFSMSFEGVAQSPEAPVTALFNAMRAHNGAQLAAQFTNSALLQRAEPGGNIKSNDINQFAGFIPIRIEVYPLRVRQNDLDHDAFSAA